MTANIVFSNKSSPSPYMSPRGFVAFSRRRDCMAMTGYLFGSESGSNLAN